MTETEAQAKRMHRPQAPWLTEAELLFLVDAASINDAQLRSCSHY